MTQWTDPPPYKPPPDNVGWVTGLMVLGGIILLLPGLCLVLFFAPSHNSFEFGVVAFWLLSSGIVIAGIVLITWAVRRMTR